MKIAPIMAEMCAFPDIEPVLVHTGQHYDQNMSVVFFRELGIPAPDYNLGIGSGSHTWQTAQVMLALEPLFNQLRPDCVLVVGDVNSTVATALVTAKMGIPLAHVEAGLRSFDRAMPEEINRQITDTVSNYLFTTSRDANDNLQREGIPQQKIHFVGNVMIDTLQRFRSQAEALQAPARYGLMSGQYAVLTLHRPSNVDSAGGLFEIVAALESVQTRLPIVFPAHPRTIERLKQLGLLERLSAMPGIRLLEPLGYLEFLGLMAQSRLVLTDSGGIQEETTVLRVPCLTLRENTERPVTVSHGTNEVVGTSPGLIVNAVWQVLDGGGKRGQVPELWDGRAAERIVAILRDQLNNR